MLNCNHPDQLTVGSRDGSMGVCVLCGAWRHADHGDKWHTPGDRDDSEQVQAIIDVHGTLDPGMYVIRRTLKSR